VQQATLALPRATRFAWLSNPTILLCIAGVVLPNALSLGALIAGIGSPPRTTAITGRQLFTPGKVTWVRLQPRGGETIGGRP
jgi:hypothetical protein